jgi:hypothetical protein
MQYPIDLIFYLIFYQIILLLSKIPLLYDMNLSLHKLRKIKLYSDDLIVSKPKIIL